MQRLLGIKQSKVELMIKFISSVCSGPNEDFNHLDNLAKGARLVNSVLSGNILDEIDIYQKEDSKY